jgi:hypothetical protein
LIRFTLGLGALLGALVLAACDDTATAPARGPYLEPTSPENVLENLITAYRRKEIDEYAKLLGPDFIFKFQDVDVQDIGLDTWNRDQDITGTGGLFGSPLVKEVRITLTYDPSTVSGEMFANVVGEVRTIRINPTFLDVDQIGGEKAGTTYRVDGDIQDMFFRRGNAAANEDTTRWFLFEWRDLPNPAGAGAAPEAIRTAGIVTPASVRTTWGLIKSLF